ncbi:kinase-like domain-containing protein [Lenzites betulinus]|nr:kinase-like domain-containing protein [Lenzites betulinus]
MDPPPPPPPVPAETTTETQDSACISTGTQSTQQRTQSTQQDSQPAEYVVDTSCWGSLVPCNAAVNGGSEFKFSKAQRTYRIGAGARGGKEPPCPIDLVLPGIKISGLHCVIEWDGDQSSASAVKVTDHARNGTFINGQRIGIGTSYILRDGNEIGFATHKPAVTKEEGPRDYRFIFRHTPASTPTTGVHKHYDLLCELGKGSFATVMKALNKAEGKWYAMKIVHIHSLNLRDGWHEDIDSRGVPRDPDAKRLLREIDVMQKLRHRNICQLKERFIESHSIYLILELVEGGDLLKYLINVGERGGRMSEAQTGYIVHQICSALAYVHSEGVAHRDLKLENVLLTKDDPPVVKVADFGLAKVIDTFTDLNSMCGSPIYLAPEVVNPGPEGYSLVVDSWSVGIITLIMLTMDRRPYIKDRLDVDIKTRVTNREVNWKRLQEFRVSKPCEAFIRGLLEHDPGRRMTMADACRNPWLETQAEVMMDPTIDNSFSSPPTLDLKSKASSSKLSHPGGLGCAILPCPQRSTRASTEEVSPPPARTPLTRTATITHEDGDMPEDTVRAYKRKVQDRSDASIGAPRADSMTAHDPVKSATGSGTEAPEPAKTTRSGGKKPTATGVKRVRTRTTEVDPAGGDVSDDVPGLALPRRSARLNSKSS